MMWNKMKEHIQFLPAGGAAEAMAEDIIHAMAEEHVPEMISVDRDDVTRLLSRPGTMRCFQKNAFWSGDSRKEALEELYVELERTAAAGRAEYGSCLRILLRIDACMDIGLEEIEGCVQAMTGKNPQQDAIIVQMQVSGGGSDRFLKVRGLLGAWDSGD